MILATLGPVDAHRLSLVARVEAAFVVVYGLLTAVASLVVEHRLEGTRASVVAVCCLSCCGAWA